jgi:uncharacterized membrane protein
MTPGERADRLAMKLGTWAIVLGSLWLLVLWAVM